MKQRKMFNNAHATDSTIAYKAAFIFVLTFCVATCNPLRSKRQTTPSYVIDTLVVIDDKMFSWFQKWFLSTTNNPRGDVQAKLKEYVSLVVHLANVRLAHMKEKNMSFIVSLQVVHMIINKTILGPSSSGRVDSDKSLEMFENWLVTNQLANKYDHAILLTGYLFDGRQGGDIKGRASVGQLCDTNGKSSSIVQEGGGFFSAHYVAHEVGHNLGSVHDGDPQSIDCSAADRFVMAPSRNANGTAQNAINPWYFSNCSSRDIKSNITGILASKNRRDCLGSTMSPMSEFTATAGIAAGQVYVADVQCQMQYGPTSRVCLGAPFGELDQICTSMFCLNTTYCESCCNQHYAAEGTSCGDKKWCRSGLCVTSTSAPAVSTVCPNGDSFIHIGGKACPEAVAANPWICYNETVRNYCCHSCLQIRTESQGCEYGDKYPGCMKSKCSLTYSDGVPAATRCCKTCSTESDTTQSNTTRNGTGDKSNGVNSTVCCAVKKLALLCIILVMCSSLFMC